MIFQYKCHQLLPSSISTPSWPLHTLGKIYITLYLVRKKSGMLWSLTADLHNNFSDLRMCETVEYAVCHVIFQTLQLILVLLSKFPFHFTFLVKIACFYQLWQTINCSVSWFYKLATINYVVNMEIILAYSGSSIKWPHSSICYLWSHFCISID